MNDKSNTHMHYPTGSSSSIDLSFCHPSLFLDFNWSVCKDQHHSDHFPIITKSNTSTVDHNPKWKLNKANWEAFQSLCTDKITVENFKDSSDPLSDFTSSLIPGESLPPCRGLWGTLHTGDDIDCNTCLLWEC